MALRNLDKVSTGKIIQPPIITLEGGNLSAKTVQALNVFMAEVTRKINGHFSLGDGSQSSWAGNFYAQWIEFLTPTVADTQFQVDHGLLITPVGRFVARQDKAGQLYDVNLGGWGDNSVYFKCDVGDVLMKILIF